MDSPTQSSQELDEIGAITVPPLKMQKLRHKQISYLAARGYPASKLDIEF